MSWIESISTAQQGLFLTPACTTSAHHRTRSLSNVDLRFSGVSLRLQVTLICTTSFNLLKRKGWSGSASGVNLMGSPPAASRISACTPTSCIMAASCTLTFSTSPSNCTEAPPGTSHATVPTLPPRAIGSFAKL